MYLLLIYCISKQHPQLSHGGDWIANRHPLQLSLVAPLGLLSPSRSEAVSLRAPLMSKVFQANAAYGAPVADTLRQIEVAVARYLRLVSTLIDEDVNAQYFVTGGRKSKIIKVSGFLGVQVNTARFAWHLQYAGTSDWLLSV